MRNPLIKRLPRELKSELGKYIVLFIFMTGMIGFVSGFLVASGSMITTHNEGFEKYNIEDGNFELAVKADENIIETLEKDDVKIYENFYIERETDDIDSTLRIFKNREEINKVCVMEGELPSNKNEIAIDRMYAVNNKISVGDKLSVDGEDLTISGFVALSDYSTLYSSPSDMMFDAVKFGIGIMTENGFENLDEKGLHFSYSWKYDTSPSDDIEAKEMSEDFLETLSENAVITNYIPQYSNQAIHMAGNDLGSDKNIITIFLYIVVLIIAFIFAITTSNTISKEATVIGTLRASGYTKGELIRHYLAMPMLVIFISAILGNILGYTIFKDVAANMYYASFSLTTYVTIWNMEAFIQTTVIPVILMLVINLVILVHKLNLSPLKFIRRDLSKKKNKKAIRLNTKLPIMHRFRLRVIFQNLPNYITVVIGIFFANVILLFGIALPSLIENYQTEITSNMICDYQYILKVPVETESENAEKYCAGSLKTIEGRLKSEDVSVFGINSDSEYVDIDLDNDNIYISSSLSEKFGVNEGETITFKESYGDKEYSFKVKGVYYYPAGISVFMDRDYFNDTFDYDTEYFNGYFSNEEIDDIDENLIATKITEDDLTKTSRQMETSMGSLMDLLSLFGIVMFMLIIYLLSKIIIEKNAQSISMTKILGYSDKEISGLYVLATSVVTIGSLILTIPIVNYIMKYICVIMLSEYSGWLPYYVPFTAYIKMAVAGILAYAIIAFIQFKKVKKIPLDIALKNVE
ncbi:MAG: FtsX-like permease family protein [Acutalibacteraceae bacterium]|nr:FtsX-like permease family protein [Acutalibacteraceae bacterium]